MAGWSAVAESAQEPTRVVAEVIGRLHRGGIAERCGVPGRDPRRGSVVTVTGVPDQSRVGSGTDPGVGVTRRPSGRQAIVGSG